MSKQITRPLEHYCGVCRYAVERHRDSDGRTWYEHTSSYENWTGAHHAPQPVPLAELTDVHMVCDMCSAPDPAFAYHFRHTASAEQTDSDTLTVYDLGEWWAICKGGADRVEARDVKGLLNRYRNSEHRLRIHLTRRLVRALRDIYGELLGAPFERLPLREVRW